MLESFNTGKFTYKKLSLEELNNRGILGRLVGIIADTKNATRNGRKYASDLWRKVFDSEIMQEKIKNHVCFGELGHPADREEVDPEKIAICLAEQPKLGNDGKIYGVFDILSTPNGKILKSLCDYGCNIGVSSRGTGDLYTDDDGNESVDPDTYNCECWDAVLIPAVKEARLQYVTESLDTKKYNKTLRQALCESLEKANESDKKVMSESLNELGIKLEESNTDTFDISDDYYEVHEPEFEEEQEQVEEELEVGDKVKVKVDNNREGEVTEIKGDQVYVEMPDDGKNPAREDSYYEQDLEKLDESYETLTSGNFFDNIKRIVEDNTPFGVKYINGYSDGLGFDIAFSEDENNPDYDFSSDPDWLLDDLKAILKSEYHADDMDVTDGVLTVMIDEDHPIKELVKEELKEEVNGDKSLNELIDDVEESMDESPEDKEDKEVVNDKSGELVAELKESLNKNKTLEADNLSLQEQLSVCNAKEAELREQLARYKQATVKLSDKAKEVKPIKESLNEKDKTIANNKKQIKSLSESLKVSKAELDSIKDSKQSAESEIEKLNESVATLTENLDKITKQLESSKLLVEKYKVSYKALKESYLMAKSESCGLHPELVLQNLNESYKIRDIDEVCKKLSKQKSTIDKLPFRINESTKISVKKADEYINGNNSYNADDEVSGYLLNLVDLK